MSETLQQTQQTTYANAHLAWLVCLSAVTHKVRRDGLLSIEGDVECPEHPNSVFYLYPQVQEQPYLEFATDVLRMMVSGNLSVTDLQVYADYAIAGNCLFSDQVDESLLRTIWLTLWAALSGYTPQMAAEFGRQAVPVNLKPSFFELDDLLRETQVKRENNRQKRDDGLDGAVDRFIASLGGHD
jgi:flagellar motor component MotA